MPGYQTTLVEAQGDGPAVTLVAEATLWQQAAPVVGTGFDSTVDNLMDLTAQFGTTGNSMTLHTFALEDLTATP